MALHNHTGKIGEAMAAEYLVKSGYNIMHQNWSYRHWEVDIIASKETVLHFIEVKTRRSVKFGLPEDRVNKKKIKNMMCVAEEYLHLYPRWKRIQFDILSITMLKNEPVEYFFIEDVFL